MTISAEFWDSDETHVALPPGQGGESLCEFVEALCGRRGWCLFQTSGSEGRAKWVALTKSALQISARAVNAHFSVTKQDRWLLALPTWHVGGFGILARCFVGGNAFTVLEGKWHAASFCERCERDQTTLASLVPTQVFDLVVARIKAPKSLRAVLVGGGALSPEITRVARELGWPLCATYGMTETASQVAAARPRGDGELEVLPIWHLETDAGGVLTVRGDALASGYVTGDGSRWRWEPISPTLGLRTRDRVELNSAAGCQRLRFVEREAGVVKILGELVALGAIQQQLDTLRLRHGYHGGDAAIVDVPDARQEARLLMAVSGMSVADAEGLRVALNREIRAFEQVIRVVPLPEIPRGALGKVRLQELRAEVLEAAR